MLQACMDQEREVQTGVLHEVQRCNVGHGQGNDQEGRGGRQMKAIKDKNYRLAVAQVLKFTSSVTRMGADHQRFQEAIYNWRDAKD